MLFAITAVNFFIIKILFKIIFTIENNLDKKNQPKNSLDGGNCSANSSRHIKNTNNNIAKDRFNYM